MVLINRKAEREMLTALLNGTQVGNSGAVVLRGEPGIGKTALLEEVHQMAATRGMMTATIVGLEAEAPIGYAALHRLLQFFPGSVDRLPPPQRDALLSTLGLIAAPPPDRFLVGLAVLTLLADSAADAPVVAVVDDAQWLDMESGTVLGFAARRLQAERVVMLFAASSVDGGPSWLSAVPELVITRLDDRDAGDLLSAASGGISSPGTRARLLEQGDGNPLALIEMTREFNPGAARRGGGPCRPLAAGRLAPTTFGAPAPAPGPRLLLAVAAAEPTAPVSLVWSARDGSESTRTLPPHLRTWSASVTPCASATRWYVPSPTTAFPYLNDNESIERWRK